MPVLPVFRRMPAMTMASKKPRVIRRNGASFLDDPFAVTTAGIVLVNAMHFDGVDAADDALRGALREPSKVFIGVALEADEARFVLDHLGGLLNEPAGFVIGRRQRRPKR